MFSLALLLLGNLVGGLHSVSDSVSAARGDHLFRTRDIKAKHEHARASWVKGDSTSGTYGLGGSAVLVRRSSDGKMSFDHFDAHLEQDSSFASLLESPRERVQLTSAGQVQAVGGQHKNASAVQHTTFQRWAQQVSWDDESALIDGLLPFLEQEHPAPLQPCQEAVEDLYLNCSDHKGVFSGQRTGGPVFLVDVSIFGFDLDLLEIKLHELASVVDLFCIIEMPVTHRGQSKPLLWARNKHGKRFAAFSDKVLHVVVDDVEVLRELNTKQPGRHWKFERRQESIGMAKMASMVQDLLARAKEAGREVVVNFGDVDEIASPKNLALVRKCQPKKVPIDHATWMPMGRFDRALTTDYPVKKELRFTYGNPTLQSLDHFVGRRFGGSGRYLLGGWHLTNYVYLPHVVIKALTCTECSGIRPDLLESLKKGQMSRIFEEQSTLRAFAFKLWPVSQVEQQWPYRNDTSLLKPPCIVANNKERYEVWFGTNDRRLQMVPGSNSPSAASYFPQMRSSRLQRHEHFMKD